MKIEVELSYIARNMLDSLALLYNMWTSWVSIRDGFFPEK